MMRPALIAIAGMGAGRKERTPASMDKYVIRYLFGQVGYAVLVAVGIAVAVWLVVHGINWLYTTTRLIGAT